MLMLRLATSIDGHLNERAYELIFLENKLHR